MKCPRRKFLHLAAGAAVLPAVSQTAWAQAYPSRPITIVVGAAAGGPTDTIARIITERMRVPLGQTIVIENNGAAAGSIAHGRIARATPDGYTLSLGHWGTHVVNAAVYTLQYDVLKDFEPIALISVSPYFMVGKRDLPANDLKDLVAWLKASGDKATQGTSGAGSPGHIGGVSLQSMLGTRWLFVPYRGANPVMQALLAGDFDWTFTTPDQGLPQIRAGRIKPYAITARSARVPPLILARALGPPGYAQGHRRDSECGRCYRLGRAGGASATWRHRTGNIPARAAAAGVARGLAEGRDRKVVANHQGGEHQSRMMITHLPIIRQQETE
jgi:tripartite-type tricarboxylate transporter receptor subunit TctC